MRAFGRVVGWILTSLAAVWALLTVLMLVFPDIDEETGEPNNAALGGLLLTSICGIPGGILLWRTGVSAREESFQNQLVGYVYSHDRFTVADLARKIGRSELQTEALIQELNVKRNIGLAFHRPTREYIHYARVRQPHAVANRCGACGGHLGQQIMFEGEQLACPYCGAPVQAQAMGGGAPAPAAHRPGGQVDVPQPWPQNAPGPAPGAWTPGPPAA